MFNQRVGRALDRAFFDAARAQHPAYQRRLAAAEFAAQRHDHAAGEQRAEACAEALGRKSVGEMDRKR